MDLNVLASFVAVAEELHFSRAALRRHLSQPALSKQVQQLERLIGLMLFVRDRRTVRLTPEGAALLPRAKAAIESARDVYALAGRLRRGSVGRIRVGFTPSAPYDVLPGLLRRFRRSNPDVETELVEASSRQQLDRLRRGSLDAGLLRPPRTPSADLHWREVSREPFVVAMPAGHPLARTKRIRLRALAGVPLVLVARRASPAVYDALIDACRSAGIVPDVRREASHVHTTLALVGGGVGVSVLPRSAARLHSRDVIFRPLAEPLVSVLALAYARAHVSPIVAAFAELACDGSTSA
jgi:DNA-binding transcriptional LysR family regulator